MASKDPDEGCNTETGDLQKKRSRRVSFAEITSVHVFDRDEEYETPPEAKASSETNADDEVFSFFKEIGDSDDSRELERNENDEDADEEEDEIMDARKGFLMVGSLSPSSIGSATSNDEENFFGPVSASFIKPGRLSDSGADANNDITMDSTAFSMHYRSIARSESEDVKTPLTSEEKTPAMSVTSITQGSSMVLTETKKLTVQSIVLVDDVSVHEDSNDMSLVGENSRRYDYGRLSPALDTLLVGSSKDLHTLPYSDAVNMSNTLDDWKNDGEEAPADIIVGETKTGPTTVPPVHISNDCSSYTNGDPIVEINTNHQIQTPHQFARGSLIGRGRIGYPLDASPLKVQLSGIERITLPSISYKTSYLDSPPEHKLENLQSSNGQIIENCNEDKSLHLDFNRNYCKHNESPLIDSKSSLSANKTKVFLNTSISPRHRQTLSLEKQPDSFLCKGSMSCCESLPSTIKSVSQIIEDSPKFTSRDRSNIHRSGDHIASPLDSASKEHNSDSENKHLDVHRDTLEDQFLSSNRDRGDHRSMVKFDGDTPGDTRIPQCLIKSNNPREGMLKTSGNSSLLVNTLNVEDDESADNLKFPQGRNITTLPLSPEYQTSLSRYLKWQDDNVKLTRFSSRAEENSMTGDERKSLLSVSPNKMVTLSKERQSPSSSPFHKSCDSKDYREFNLQGLQSQTEKDTTFQTPLKDTGVTRFLLESPERKTQIRTHQAQPKDELTQGVFESSSRGPSSLYVHRRGTDDSPLLKNLVKTPQSHSKKELCDSSFNDNFFFENSHARKRRSEGIFRDVDHICEVISIQRSPKSQKSERDDLMILSGKSHLSSDKTKTGVGAAIKRWTDIFTKVSGDTKQILSPLMDKLDQRAIILLEDYLVDLQKVKAYEMLCSRIQSQESTDFPNNIKHKRAAETKMLVHKLIFEQVKFQLMSLKREKLQKRVEQLKFVAQGLQSLKLDHSQYLSVHGVRYLQIDDAHSPADSVHVKGMHTVVSDLNMMRQEVESLERKIKFLVQYLHTHFEVKGEPNYSGIIVLVTNHLKKRICCQFIRQNMQLWDVDSLEGKNGHYNIVLNYGGLIFQRFILHPGPLSTIILLNKLDDINIAKSFPDMDACTAFTFMLKAEGTKKYVGLRSLAQQTQITSLVLGNLLDVLQEIQLARVELRNLSEAVFHSPSDEQLDLQLCFVDLTSARKVTLTLDLTCVNRGIYPSEILPSKLEISAPESDKLLPQSVSAKVRAAMECVRTGYSRILRLCRCVSADLKLYVGD